MTKLTTPHLNRAVQFVLRKKTLEEYLEVNPIDDEETLEEFKQYWADLDKEIKDTELPKGHYWAIPAE